MLIRLLNAVDERELRRRLRSVLADEPSVYVQTLRKSTTPVWTRLSRFAGDIAIIHRDRIPEPASESIASLRRVPDAPELVVLDAAAGNDDRARLMAAGAFAFLDSALEDGLLREALLELIERVRQGATESLIREQEVDVPRLGDFVTQSASMRSFMAVVERVVDSDATLLITGETGVGKERLARAVHDASPRSRHPFVAVNCGALPETLLDSELFGHREGAFTGATRTRRGWFELAHHGTIFLDEIGEMPLHLQVRLLRVLQSREVTPVGSEAPVQIDVRVLAATNCDLAAAVKEKRFREDLFYRLSVVSLAVPPLRERREDVHSLAMSYVQYFQSRFATSVAEISPAAIRTLEEYDWPGNIRELVNVVERAMLLCRGTTIERHDLPESISGERRRFIGEAPAAEALGDEELLARPFRDLRRDTIRAVELRYLDALLRRTRGRIGEAANLAGMTTRNLFQMMQRHSLRKEDYRS